MARNDIIIKNIDIRGEIMSYKTTDGLMRHLRDNGISIGGSIQKRQSMNTGYLHGYKG